MLRFPNSRRNRYLRKKQIQIDNGLCRIIDCKNKPKEGYKKYNKNYKACEFHLKEAEKYRKNYRK